MGDLDAGGSAARASADLGRQLHLAELDLADQTPRLAWVDQAGAEAAGGLRAAGHAEAQTLVGRARFVARGEIAREKRIARSALGDRLAPAHQRAREHRLTIAPDLCGAFAR